MGRREFPQARGGISMSETRPHFDPISQIVDIFDTALAAVPPADPALACDRCGGDRAAYRHTDYAVFETRTGHPFVSVADAQAKR